MKLAFRSEPQVVEFWFREDVRKRVPTPDHEVRVFRLYQPQNNGEPGVIPCECPRTVRPNRDIAVWHSPECPEVERNA